MRGRRRSTIVAATLALCVVGTAVAVAALSQPTPATASSESADRPSRTTTSTTEPPSTTTTVVIERVGLPAGTREIATALPTVDTVEVRSTPPPGWDRTLTPVVTSADPRAPRSGLDVDRVAMRSADEPISGRHVSATGWSLSNPTTFTPPQSLVFSVVQRQGPWIEVELPVRPNGTTGWIDQSVVELSSTSMRVEVSLTARTVRVIDASGEIFSAPAGIGRPATPTPTGEFYVTDIVPSVDPDGGYGPVALALNGYSEVMDQFAGESGVDAPDAVAPVLAIHGTNRPSSVGQDVSNGCPRLYNDDIVRLAQLVPAGTPVQIWP